MREALPPVEWVVEPLLAHGDRAVIYGEFASGKSWLLLHLGLQIAAGTPWLEHFKVERARSVLYIDEEMNERTLRRRVKRLGLGMEAEESPLPFRTLSRVGIRFDATGAKRLLDALEASGFDAEVIIVEALRRVLVGSENEAVDVGGFWRNAEPIVRMGKTLIVSHHMRKPNMNGGDANRHRASGSTDILAGADTAYAIQRLAKDAILIEGVKSRESEEHGVFVASMMADDPEGPVSMRFEGTREEFVEGERKSSLALSVVLRHLTGATGPVPTDEILRQLELQGIARRTGERVLTILAKNGRLVRARRGFWQLAEPARAAAA
jgi:hypothetical protein